MKTNPRVKSFLISSIILFILFGLSICSSPNALGQNIDSSISRSVVNSTEIRETIAAIEAENKIEYMQIYDRIVQEEEQRIADPSSTQSKFVKFALKFEGTPYWYGGSTPSAFDCSGFVGYVLKHQLGIEVRHSATSQMQLGKRVKYPLPGDLVGFGYGNHFGHIGIYVGNGKIIDALNPYRDIGVRSLDWMESNVGPAVFTRVIEADRNFNPHKITQDLINKQVEFAFAP
jgi:cell wall-associated NlpC family hydrolase